MDGRTQYARIVKMMENFELEKIYNLNSIKEKIMMNISSNEKKVKEILHMMNGFGFIKEVAPRRFKILKKNGK